MTPSSSIDSEAEVSSATTPAPRRTWRTIAGWAVVTIGIGLLFAILRFQPLRSERLSQLPPMINSPGMNSGVKQGLERLRQRVEKQPESSRAWGSFGMGLMQHELPLDAIVCFSKAIELDSSEAKWNYYSAILLEQRDLNQSLTHYELAIQKNPKYLPARLRFASALIAKGDFEKASDQLIRVNQIDPRIPQAYLQLMRIEKLQSKATGTTNWLETARAEGVISRGLLEEAARAALARGHASEADRIFQDAARLPLDAPVSDPWFEALAVLDASGSVAAANADQLRQRGQISEAATLLSMLSKQFPDRSRPALNHALSLREQGLMTESIQELHDLAKRFPNDPVIRYHYATTLATAEQNSAAISELEVCLKLKPDYGMARAIYGDLLQAVGREADGIREARSAVELSPGDPWIRIGLIALLQRCGRIEEAITELKEAKTIIRADQQNESTVIQQLEMSLGSKISEDGRNSPAGIQQ